MSSSSTSETDSPSDIPNVLNMFRKFSRPLAFYFILRQSTSFFTNSDDKDLPPGGAQTGIQTFEELDNKGAYANGVFPSSKARKPAGVTPQSSTPKSSNPLSSWIPDAVTNPYGDVPTFSKQGPQHRCVWGLGAHLDVTVYITESFKHSLDSPHLLKWSVNDWEFGSPGGGGFLLGGGGEGYRQLNATVKRTDNLANNGTAYAHVYVGEHGGEVGGEGGYYTRVEMNKWRVRRKNRDVRNLMGDFGVEEKEEVEKENEGEDTR
jgi:hypothetical protein